MLAALKSRIRPRVFLPAISLLPLLIAGGGCPPQQPPPPTLQSLPEIIDSRQQFSTLSKALEAAGLVATLNSQGPYTIFAPTNDAFDKLPSGMLNDWLKPENKEKLRSVLLSHVSPDRFTDEDLLRTSSVRTANGKTLLISNSGGLIRVEGANVVGPQADASNGILHPIDTVLMP